MRAIAFWLWLAGMAWSGAAGALPISVDADADGYLDTLEAGLGSDPNDDASVPEHAAAPPSCLDAVDNDGDDDTDLDDAGCVVPPPSTTVFPPAGIDAFESSLSLDAYPLAGAFGVCPADVTAEGPTVVSRGAPTDVGGGLREMQVEMLAMQLTGTATILADAACSLPPGDVPITIFESPTQATTGTVTDTNADPASDFPADSFFDVFFDIETPIGVVPGGPPGGPPGDPVRVTNQIAGIPPYQGKTSLCYQVPLLTHEHCPVAPPDHYLCYTGKFSPKFQRRDVLLRDQFDADEGSTHKVMKPLYLCTPVAKNGEPLYEPNGHLTCYVLKAQKQKQQALVRNQFGERTVQTKKSQLLCLPAEKNGEGESPQLDHFKCYNGKFTPKLAPRPVTLVDQFGIVETQVKGPQRLCNPVSKNGEGIRHPLRHLECHKLAPKKVAQTAEVVDQFGTMTVTTKKAVSLCVPSSKNAGVSTTTTTTVPQNGRAVTLDFPLGSLQAGAVLCLDEITSGGCVAGPDACSGVHLHGGGVGIVVPSIGVDIPAPDPNQPECGYGQVGTSPDCGPDGVPSCGG
jgi:hypothetical protein